MKDILGIIHFGQPLVCRGDILGNSFDAVINGINVKLHFPELRITQFDEQVRLSLEAPKLLETAREDEWGNIYCHDASNITNLQEIGSFVYQVVMTGQLSDDLYEDSAKKLFDGINTWRTQFYERLSLARKNCPLSLETDHLERGGVATGFELYRRDTEGYSLIDLGIHSMTFDLYFLKATDAVCPEELQEILNAIDISKHLKIEYEMLMNAFFEQEKGNTRYAIMEATTAVELCVSQKIKEYCNILGIDGKGLCDAFYRSLGDRFNLLKHLGIELASTDPSKELVKPRNDLFHNRTLVPTQEACEQVIKSAEAYLRAYAPEMYV